MTLTTNGKNYIANTFGNTSKCYTSTGLNWSYLGTDNLTYTENGGTAQLVSRLILTSLVQSVTYNGQTYTYTTLKIENDNTDLILSDAQWIAQNDGTPTGETQYCYTPITGSVLCTTSPSGASISIDGVNQGLLTPSTLPNIAIGTHTVTFNLSGYNSCQVSVTVTTGSTVNASCTLTPTGTTITVGSNCLLRNNFTDAGYTYMDYKNPSPITTTLTNACLYIQALFGSPSTIEIKSFVQQSGNIYQVYDSTSPISITSNGLVNIPINLNIVSGGYIGFYSSNLRLYMTIGLSDPNDLSPLAVSYAAGNPAKGTNFDFVNYISTSSISLQGNNLPCQQLNVTFSAT